MDKSNWHDWFAWYPVYSIEYGWVWLRWLRRKQIPADYKCPIHPAYKRWGESIGEYLTGCWHRIPDLGP